MGKQQLALSFAAAAALALAWVQPAAAQSTSTTTTTTTTTQQQGKAKQSSVKKSQPAAKPPAKPQTKAPAAARKIPQKPVRKQALPRQQPPSPVAAGPKPITDTESRITKAGDHRFAITHGGLQRSYRVHVPPRYDPAVPAPLLVVLHGAGSSMEQQAHDGHFGLISKSDRESFIVVFPNASTRLGDGKTARWNAVPAREQAVDDVGFIRQVVTNVFRQMSVDRNRIFAAGMSNGGSMAYRLACEMPHVFKAVASVAGSDGTAGCIPARPVAVLHFHAKNDTTVPFGAGLTADEADKSKMVQANPVSDGLARWAKLNGCTATPRRTLESAGAYCEAYSFCQSQAEVQMCVTEAGGHSWPGGTRPRGEVAPSQAISATDVMWDFFSRR